MARGRSWKEDDRIRPSGSLQTTSRWPSFLQGERGIGVVHQRGDWDDGKSVARADGPEARGGAPRDDRPRPRRRARAGRPYRGHFEGTPASGEDRLPALLDLPFAVPAVLPVFFRSRVEDGAASPD